MLAQSSMQPIRGRDGRKKEELSGHTGRAIKRQQSRRSISCSSHSKWSWIRDRSLSVHASVSLRHIFFNYGLVDVSVQGNLLCRKDWLRLREIARSEWAIVTLVHSVRTLLLRKLPRGARLAKWANVGWSPWYRSADKVDGPYTGCPDSISDSEPEHLEWDLDGGVGCCRSVLKTQPSLQPTEPFQPGLPLQELPSQPRRSFQRCHLSRCDRLTLPASCKTAGLHSDIHFAPCSVEPLLARSILAQEPAAAILHCQCQPNPRKWTPGVYPPRLEIACAGRPFAHPAWPRGTKSSRLSRNCPTPARRCPRTGWGRRHPRTSSRQHSRWCEAPKRERRRHRRGGEPQAQSCEYSKKQTTTFHFTSLPCHRLTTPLHAPNHSRF